MQSQAPTRIEDVASLIGQHVVLRGWVGARRSGGRVAFVELRDGSGVIQAVFAGPVLTDAVQESLRALSRESSVEIEGVVRRDDRAAQGVELDATALRLLHHADEWPLPAHDRSDDTRVDARHLYLRSRRMGAILRLRAILARAARHSLDAQGFLHVDAPIFTPNVVEESGTLFDAPNASAIAYLTQSGQLYNEASAMAFGRVYSFGPVFRSERKPTHRHLAEFWMLEPEIAFGSLEDVITTAEHLVQALLTAALTEGRAHLEALDVDCAALEACRAPFERMRYDEAIAAAQAAGVAIQIGDDLDAEAEAAITRERTTPVWVVGFPAAIKSFYMHRDPDHPDRVVAADLLAPRGYGEILGGGEREVDYETLCANLRERGLDEDAFRWYLDLRRFGTVPHSGFGMGLERALVWIANLSDIDEAIPFPRLPTRSAP